MQVEDILNPISLTLMISSITGIISGILVLKYPPKEINWSYGYRTSTSMKNKQTWDFAQRFMGDLILKSSFYVFCLSILGYLIPLDFIYLMILGIIILFAWVVYLIIRTEKAIKQNFPNIFKR